MAEPDHFVDPAGVLLRKKWSQCFWRKSEQQTLDLNLQSLAHTSCRIFFGKPRRFLTWDMLRNLKRAAAHLAMVLAPVNELSDAEPAAPDAPAAPSSSKDKQAALPSSTQAQPADALSPKPKGQAKGKAKAKAKAKGKGKAKPQAKKTDDKSAVKAKPSLKRPAAAASDEEPPMKKPASCHEEEPPMKKPASSTVLHRGVWTNIDMLEMEFGVSKCRKSKSSGWARGWKQMQIPCVGVRCFVILKSFCPWNSVKSFCPWKVKPAEFVSPAELEEIAVPHPKMALPQISSLSWFSLIELSGLNKFTL